MYVPVDITSHTLKHVYLSNWDLQSYPHILLPHLKRLTPNVSSITNNSRPESPYWALSSFLLCFNTRSSYRVRWYHDTSNAILLHCHSYYASLILFIYLRAICILLYFLCTYNHIEYCITYVTYCSWRHHGNKIPLIYCISFCICHILMNASIPYIPIVSYVFPFSTILTA